MGGEGGEGISFFLFYIMVVEMREIRIINCFILQSSLEVREGEGIRHPVGRWKRGRLIKCLIL